MADGIFTRTESLIGKDAVQLLSEKRVALFGVGGVGSFAGEALARGGIGNIDLFDSDTVDITNINRQLIALNSTVGRDKVAVMKSRMEDINKSIKVTANKIFITPQVAAEIDFKKYDYILDCIDNVTAKIALCELSKAAGVPIISAMGAGNKLDPTAFKVADIEKTSVCPLARVMRLELRKRNIKKVKCIYSTEISAKPDSKGQGKPTPASISFVPSVMGLIMAGEVIKDLSGGKLI